MARRDIEIKTTDGTAKAWLFAPPSASRSGIILYMDAFGLRPAIADMAERTAAMGHHVLAPDLFYRFGDYGSFDAKTAFAEEATRDRLRGMLDATTQAMTRSDSAAFVEAITSAGATGKLATVGYCMGGGRAITAAAAHPDRIAAAASFHGGNLASDAEDSPHRAVATVSGRIYVGVSGVDRSFPPEQSARLAQALREAEIDHVIENYVGKAHGWCVPDHSVYDEAGAERHWTRLGTLFSETLAG